MKPSLTAGAGAGAEPASNEPRTLPCTLPPTLPPVSSMEHTLKVSGRSMEPAGVPGDSGPVLAEGAGAALSGAAAPLHPANAGAEGGTGATTGRMAVGVGAADGAALALTAGAEPAAPRGPAALSIICGQQRR